MRVLFSAADRSFLIILVVLALFIWFRDVSWMTSSDDTLPILVALPIFVWLGAPWEFKSHPQPLSPYRIILSVILFLIGIVANSTLILTIGWTLLLWTWLLARVESGKLPSLRKLLILPLMAFPWVSLDADRIGWWFRLSGAWAAAKFFALVGSDVTQEGTMLVVNGLPISVEVACAGLNTLQSMLISGSVVAFLILGETNRYWWNLPLLIGISWLANTVRIITISAAAVLISPKFAQGSFHQFGGWVVLIFMFGLCWFVFYLQEPQVKKKA
jgi:exosortase/archaeosortase family protein